MAYSLLLLFLSLLLPPPLLAAHDSTSSALLRHHPRLSTALQQLLDRHPPPEILADLLRHFILPESRSLGDLALARDPTPASTLRRPRSDPSSVRFRLEEADNAAQLPDESGMHLRKSLLEVPARISVSETSELSVSRATAPAPATSPTPAPAPAPAPLPVNITQVMVSAGEYSTFISLLQVNKVDVILQSLANQTQGVSIFCPTNNAFANLSSNLLKNLSSQQLVSLLEYHAMPSFHSLSTFQQTSNSVFNTVASQYNGGTTYTLNVSNEQGTVVFSTGYDKATLVSTLYNTNPAALYAIDHVLLPVDIFGVAAPTPAPSPSTLAPAPSNSVSGSGTSSTAGAPSPSANDASPPPSLRALLLATLLFSGFKLFQL